MGLRIQFGSTPRFYVIAIVKLIINYLHARVLIINLKLVTPRLFEYNKGFDLIVDYNEDFYTE